MTQGLCYRQDIIRLTTAGTPVKVTPTGFNQLFLAIGLSGIGSTDDILTIIFKQNTENTVSMLWNKGGLALSISDQTSYLNVSCPTRNNVTCMMLSNFPFTVG